MSTSPSCFPGPGRAYSDRSKTMFPDLTRDDVFRLETRRLWLRWPRLADAQAVVRLAGEKPVADMTARIPHPYHPEQAERFIFEARRSNANGEGLQLAITPKGKPNSLIGMVGITADPDTGKPNLGYWLGIPSWGQGYATEAARALIDAFFAYGEGSEITACARVVNPASRRVLEKCGFAYQGAGLSQLPARCGLYPVDHFRLDRRTWESLKTWSHTGFIPEPSSVEVELDRSVSLAS
jgi:RimJ/RimL family protein N-acetyltransferase